MSLKSELIEFANQHNGWLPGVLEICVFADWADDATILPYLSKEIQGIRRLPRSGIGAITRDERDFLETFGE